MMTEQLGAARAAADLAVPPRPLTLNLTLTLTLTLTFTLTLTGGVKGTRSRS